MVKSLQVAGFVAAVLMGASCPASRLDPSGQDIHAIRLNLDYADFAVLATLIGIESCGTDVTCAPMDPIPSIARTMPPERAWFGQMSHGIYVSGRPFPVEAINWWARGRPVKLLLVGNTGPEPGWSAPQEDEYSRLWPACGFSTNEQLAASGYGRAYIWDEENGTVFDVDGLGSYYQRNGTAEMDAQGRAMPAKYGSPDPDHLGDDAHEGYVRYQYDWDRALQEAAAKDIARSTASFRYGTCVEYIQR